MKVLHLISGGDTGGAKTHVLSLVKELGKRIDVKLICFLEDEFYYEGKSLGIDIEVFKQKKRYDLSVIKRLKDVIVDNNYDIIHCHGARANFVGMMLKRMVKKPFITTIHSDYKLDFKDNLYKCIVYTTINSLALRFFDYYIAISTNFKNMLVDRGFDENKIFTVYNGIDFNSEIKITPKELFLKSFGIDPKDKIIVGIMGRLEMVKDHETFVKAAINVLKNRDDVIFLIAGSGAEEKRLFQLVKEHGLQESIYFLGFVKEPYSFFNAIDINVLTSKSESFPYVVLEGARMKKPILCTNVGGLGDLVVDGVNGHLFEVGDILSLSNYINFLLDNRSKIRQLGENLYKDVIEKFSLEKMTNEHVKIYEKILDRRV
ncbi:glycosyltransferase family 4 protein [Caloranaerobacter azorensis]|uniref:Glycosyltransferase family 4 protein n=1 Tax=Caloranaerobacter azorensis TaxID=116090 RepID=A0A6P1YDE4_9FIRM|nr:glycosyltransferase family 4 protein [Caloranaerobacter azorensis]QIB26942.1 glycosyltransferase family 4 protein [Caloranaerobacter azorensis]